MGQSEVGQPFTTAANELQNGQGIRGRFEAQSGEGGAQLFEIARASGTFLNVDAGRRP